MVRFLDRDQWELCENYPSVYHESKLSVDFFRHRVYLVRRGKESPWQAEDNSCHLLIYRLSIPLLDAARPISDSGGEFFAFCEGLLEFFSGQRSVSPVVEGVTRGLVEGDGFTRGILVVALPLG